MGRNSKSEVVEACLATIRESTDQLSPAYIAATYGLIYAMTGSHREQLTQLVRRGPTWDGDVVSKVARDDLISWGLAVRVCVNGVQGYTAATYLGWDVLSVRDATP